MCYCLPVMARTKASLKKVQTVGGITEYRLTNGLRVLYKRERAAPVVAVCVTFHVGSRNEDAGHTGSTHILEHLLFKDSKKFNKKNGNGITDYLEWFGAYTNASTWLDRTNYFEVLPRERLDEALEMEADRMRDSLFSDADLASEMTVVRNEYERSRNNPFELLEEEVWHTAYTTHPYRIPTIGLKEDIEGATAAKLREFYDRFYWPNNSTLAVFGDASFAEMEKSVLKHFASIKSSPQVIPVMTVVEPEQTESRMVTMKKPLGISIATLAYKIPSATHADYPAVTILAAILAGGFASRLQKKIADKGLATELYLSVPALRDIALLSFTAHVAEGVDTKKVLTAMRKEITAAVRLAPTAHEVSRAKERLLSEIAGGRDGVFTEIRDVSEAVAAGDWTLGYRLDDLLARTRVSDVVRVAKKYLTSTQETAGILEQEQTK